MTTLIDLFVKNPNHDKIKITNFFLKTEPDSIINIDFFFMKKAMTWQLEDYSSNNLKLEEDSHVPLFWKKSHVVAVFVERFCNKIHDVRTLIEYFSKKRSMM